MLWAKRLNHRTRLPSSGATNRASAPLPGPFFYLQTSVRRFKGASSLSAVRVRLYRMISDKEHPKVQRRLAEIHLAKISKLDRGEQLTDELPAVQTDDQAT